MQRSWRGLVILFWAAFIPIPKKGNTKDCSNYSTIVLISHTSKVMLKILQDGFNCMWTETSRCSSFQMINLPTVWSLCWIIEKAREFQKNIYFCFIDYAKASDCLDHNKMGKILQEMGIPEDLTRLLRKLHAGQEATVSTEHGKMDWFQIGKGVHQRCILSPCLLNFMQSTSCEMMRWMKQNLESRLPGEISITSDVQITPPLCQEGKN